MKAIINGRRYDTEKCTLIGRAEGGSPYVTDFSHWEAALYVTPRSGHYFLAGEGGPMTRFARHITHTERTGGSGIQPISAEEALAWAEEYLPNDVVEAHFGDMIEDA